MKFNIINISENIDDIDTISDNLLQHIAIDYIYESGKYNLFEKYGIYNGCTELVDYICKKVKQKFNSKNDVFMFTIKYNDCVNKKIENIFFNSLDIYVKKSDDNTGGYVKKEDAELNDNGLMENIKIELYINSIDKLNVLLAHELTHAYEHYRKLVTDYHIPFRVRKQQILRYNTYLDMKKFGDNIESIIADILYHLDKSEQNAYTAQLRKELENNKSIIHGPKDAFDVIKNTEVYTNLKTMEDIIINEIKLKNGLSDDIIHKCCDAYRVANDVNWTDNKVIKKFAVQFEKYKNHFDKIIPKMCLDFLNNETKEIYETYGLIPLKKYLKNNLI